MTSKIRMDTLSFVFLLFLAGGPAAHAAEVTNFRLKGDSA
jgi:hypothetical protein